MKIVLKKYATLIITVLFIVMAIGSYKLLPLYFLPKPKLVEINPTVVVASTEIGSDVPTICISGENLEHITGIYINDVIEYNCWILVNTAQELQFRLPEYYYYEPKELEFMVEVRSNSDITRLSNKIKLVVE